MSRKKHRFEPHHDALIRERYDSQTETIDWLSKHLAVPRWAVKKRAQELGLARTKEKPWSREEVEYLQTWLPRRSLARLARRLGRSATAVSLKAKRLGIRKSEEGYTASSLALAFGVDAHKVTRWIDAGMLRASHRGTARYHDMYFISESAVKEFVRNFPTDFDLRKVDQLWFIDLMSGGLSWNASDGSRPINGGCEDAVSVSD